MHRCLYWRTCLALAFGLACGLFGLTGAGPALAESTPQVVAPAVDTAGTEETPADQVKPKPKPKSEADEAIPEIDVEVVGERNAEQAVPSLAPSPGEVITSINAAELEATGETNLADALEFLPGVSITHQGRRYETFVNIRGATAPIFLLDGALISSGNFSGRILYSLPMSVVERVDVIRSSSSLIYGPQALSGGVINIVTKSGKGKTPGEYTTSLDVGSYQYLRGGLSVAQGEADKGLFLAGDYDTANSNLEFGGHRLTRAFLKSDQDLKGGATLKFSLLSNDGQRSFDVWDEDWQSFASTKPAYWGIDPYREKLASLCYSRPFSATSGVDAVLYYRHRFYHNFSYGGSTLPKTGATVYYDEVDSTLGTNLIFRFQPLRSHYVRAGMESYRTNGYSMNYKLLASGDVAAQAPTSTDTRLGAYFAQDEWTISPRTRFFYGGRFEVPPDRDTATTYSLGLERDLSKQSVLYAHFGTGVDYPTEATLESNPDAKDETSANTEIGFQHRFGANHVGRFGWFHSVIKNYPVSYLKDGGDPLVSGDYISTDGDYTQAGLEAELKGTLSAKHGLNYFGNYTYTHQDVDRMPTDAAGQTLQLAVPPKGQYSLGLRWAANTRTNVAFSYTNVGDRLARSGYYALAYPLEGYGYANLTLSRELGAGWRANASLRNVFDAEYESQPGFPRPGRNYSIGFSHTAKIQ